MVSLENEGDQQNDEKEEKKENGDYFKDEDQYPFLPFPYIHELMKDLLEIIRLN